jgi:hypothetical protein
MLRWLGWGIAACFRLRAPLVVENICLRQQLLVLRRRQPRPRIRDADRRFWVLACRWFADWRRSLLIVKPETVLRWHRRGWRAYWRRRSRWGGKAGRRPIAPELRNLIRRMASENRLWAKGGSKQNWQGLVSESLRGPLESICVVRGMGSCLRVGARSSSDTRRRFGPATSSACGRSSFKRFMSSSLSITPTGKFSTSRRRGIRRPNGQAGRSSSAAAGIGSHRAFSFTIVTGAMVRSSTDG